LSDSIIQSGNENAKLAEMVAIFKNRLMVENCFHTKFGASKAGSSQCGIIVG